jgi:hypothetical protein
MTSTIGYEIAQDQIAYLGLMIGPWVMDARAAVSATFITHSLP